MYSDFILQVLQDASRLATKGFGRVAATRKGHDANQVVTETDLKVGQLLISAVSQAFPGYNIIDEEHGVIDHRSEFTWVIDPIDGTSNFAQGVPLYGTMIGLLRGGEPVAGGIALPYFRELIAAEQGKGAFFNDKRLAVTKQARLLDTLVAYGIDSRREEPRLTYQEGQVLAKLVLSIRNLRTSGSVFDQVMVAKGHYGASLTQTSKIWDNVAQAVVIREAGGLYTDFYGKELDFTQPTKRFNDNFTWCTAAPGLHRQLQKIIHSR